MHACIQAKALWRETGRHGRILHTHQKGERSGGDQLHNAWNNPHSIASKQHSKAGRSPTIELSQIGDLVSMWSISMTNVTIAHGGNMLHSSRPGCMAGTSIRCVRHWGQRKLNEPGPNKHKIDPHWHNRFHPEKQTPTFKTVNVHLLKSTVCFKSALQSDFQFSFWAMYL